MHKLIISWEDYHQHIIELAKLIKQDFQKHKFDQILCLARGGVPIGDALSRIFNLPLAILFTSSYKLQKQGDIYIDNQIAKQNNQLGKNILLVDDLVDSGITLQKVAQYLKEDYQLENIKTAVIWKKESSLISPDYFVKTVGEEWIEQPFEVFDNIKL